MLLDNTGFSKQDLMQYVNDIFERFLGKDIELLEEKHSEGAAGYFALKYQYFPKNYEIKFEHEKMMYSIRIMRQDDAFTSVNHIFGERISNGLNKENIHNAIRLLSEAVVDDKLVFYKTKNNRQVTA